MKREKLIEMAMYFLIGFIGTLIIGKYCCAGQIEIKPFMSVPIKSDINISHGEGIGLDYVFNNGFLAYGSLEIIPVEDFGNWNPVVLGIGYKKQWKKWNVFGKVGALKSHDSDLFKQNAYTTTQKVYKLVKSSNTRCYQPKYEEVLISQTHYVTEKREFGNGGVLELGVGYSYPLSEAWSLGVDLSGRYLKVELNDNWEDVIHGKGSLVFNLEF